MDSLSKGALALAIVATGAGLASAQSSVRVLANVPFAFTAGGQTLAAGDYAIHQTSDTADVLELQNTGTNKAVMVSFLARLGQRNDMQAALVFDKNEDGVFLSEIHVPGEDGYLVANVPKRHVHDTVTGTRK
jgi:hypothetical protein